MKAIITIIILALVAWGVWSWMDDGDAENSPAAVNEALDLNADASLDADADAGVDLGEFEDKG